jgi:hypothetical protein
LLIRETQCRGGEKNQEDFPEKEEVFSLKDGIQKCNERIISYFKSLRNNHFFNA